MTNHSDVATSTILIVDDEPSARDTLEALLMAQGYHLVFACNGAEALARAAECAPDVILLDVMMPDMDGFEVCQCLRADPKLAEVPIIMVTALEDRASRLRGLEVGADEFISKPYDRAELRARVQTITQLNRYRRLLAERTRFEWVIQNAGDGYVITTQDDKIIYTNPQARLYLGMPFDETDLASSLARPQPQASFYDLAQKHYRCEPQEAWAAYWPANRMKAAGPAAPQPALYLVRPESPTASAFWLQVNTLNVPALPGGGRVIHLRDVTFQMALRRDVWGFHSAVNHKLRAPLVIMLNSLELQVREMNNLSSAEVSELSRMALQSVIRLRDNIGDILQYLNASALIEAGERFRFSKLEAMVDEISTYEGLVDVTLSLDPDLAQGWLDLPDRAIELILWELLENAKKFHPARAPQIEVLVQRAAPGQAIFKICDDGIHLSPEQLARAWTPYYQGEKYFTGQALGMGLGLPIVGLLVWNAGGSCRLHNREDGPGLVVEIMLPVAESEQH